MRPFKRLSRYRITTDSSRDTVQSTHLSENLSKVFHLLQLNYPYILPFYISFVIVQILQLRLLRWKPSSRHEWFFFSFLPLSFATILCGGKIGCENEREKETSTGKVISNTKRKTSQYRLNESFGVVVEQVGNNV